MIGHVPPASVCETPVITMDLYPTVVELASAEMAVDQPYLSEQHDLSTAEPDCAGKLREALRQWRHAVGARMPEPNLSFDPGRAAELAKRRRNLKGMTFEGGIRVPLIIRWRLFPAKERSL